MGKKYNNKIVNILHYIIISFIILGCIIFIIWSKYSLKENFSPISIEYDNKKKINRKKLQCLIDKFEKTNNCRPGYIQPVNFKYVYPSQNYL